MTTNLHDKMLAAIDALFSASDAVEEEAAENLLLDVRDEINKHKLAAESLTEGLRLDDWPQIGCVNHDCDKCKAQQEPVATLYGTLPVYDKPAQRTWVGLTDEDIEQGYETTGHYQTLRPQDRFAVFALARAIEAKLKEKNT